MTLIKFTKLQKLFAAGAILAVVLFLPVFPLIVSADYWNPTTKTCVVSTTQNDPPCGLKGLVYGIVDIINLLQNFLVALSVFIIIWGTFRYLIASGDKERLTKAKDVIVYGLLGIVIIYSIMGIIQILLGTFQFTGGRPPIPQL